MALHFNRPTSLLFVIILLAVFVSVIRADKELLCLVCNAVAEEIEVEVSKVKPGLKMQVGSYRIDASGNQVKTEVAYARSETHLNDVLDRFCERMDDYAEATYKQDGKRTILKLTSMGGGGMHPDIGKVDFVQDGDLNKKLKFYCETIIEEYEDNIMTIFATEQMDASKQLCVKATGFCSSTKDDDESDENDDNENYQKPTSEKHEL